MSMTIDSLQIEISSSSQSAASGIEALTKSLEKLKVATKGGLGLGAVASQVGNVKNASKSYGNFAIKLGVASLAIRKIGSVIAGSIKQTNDYIENMNLFNVAMGRFADQAGQYAETVGETMGINPSEWMRNQGVFMTLATGFGVVSDRAFVMSQNLTQLGYDISSFFNIPIAEAMQKLQSGVSGEIEPLVLAA